MTIIDLKDFDMPMYGIDAESKGIPEKALALRQIMNEHDALVIASPEHNGSMSAFLKKMSLTGSHASPSLASPSLAMIRNLFCWSVPLQAQTAVQPASSPWRNSCRGGEVT